MTSPLGVTAEPSVRMTVPSLFVKLPSAFFLASLSIGTAVARVPTLGWMVASAPAGLSATLSALGLPPSPELIACRPSTVPPMSSTMLAATVETRLRPWATSRRRAERSMTSADGPSDPPDAGGGSEC